MTAKYALAHTICRHFSGWLPEPVAAAKYVPVVAVRKSPSSLDHLISVIDGKPHKTLRRHLSGHGLTPEEYRACYSLKADYPMVAPAYSEAHRAMAKMIGLGRKPGQKLPAKAAPTTPAKRGHPSAAVKAADSAAQPCQPTLWTSMKDAGIRPPSVALSPAADWVLTGRIWPLGDV